MYLFILYSYNHYCSRLNEIYSHLEYKYIHIKLIINILVLVLLLSSVLCILHTCSVRRCVMLEKSIFVIINICLLLAVSVCLVGAYECPFLVLKLIFVVWGMICIAFMLITLHIFKGS